MKIKISSGAKENGIIIGNTYDKYNSQNFIVKWIMKGFDESLSNLISKANPTTIHEVGCGEGYWVLQWKGQGLNAKGCDFSSEVIEIAKENAIAQNIPPSIFKARSIYDLNEDQDISDLIVCCEVLEHLEHPEIALQALQKVSRHHLILSVPREPIWRILNVLRGKYLAHLGNTPGHIQHWSKNGFIELVSRYFEIIEVRNPLPWTMLLCRPYL